MAKENILDKVEGAKVWGYVAMGAGLLAVVGIAIAVKETMDARKIASVKKDVEKEAETVVVENGSSENGESTSGCSGCSSSAEGGWKIPTLRTEAKTESFSGARGINIWKQPRGGGDRHKELREDCNKKGGSYTPLGGYPVRGRCAGTYAD